MSYCADAKRHHLKLVEWLNSPKSKRMDHERKDKLFEQSLKDIEMATAIDGLIASIKRLQLKSQEQSCK
jgi:hypothetical protein